MRGRGASERRGDNAGEDGGAAQFSLAPPKVSGNCFHAVENRQTSFHGVESLAASPESQQRGNRKTSPALRTSREPFPACPDKAKSGIHGMETVPWKSRGEGGTGGGFCGNGTFLAAPAVFRWRGSSVSVMMSSGQNRHCLPFCPSRPSPWRNMKHTVIDKKLFPVVRARDCAAPKFGLCPCCNRDDAFVSRRDRVYDDFWHRGLDTPVKAPGDSVKVAGAPRVPHCPEPWNAPLRLAGRFHHEGVDGEGERHVGLSPRRHVPGGFHDRAHRRRVTP